MSDLPDDPSELTEEQARSVEAGPVTDNLCLLVMDVPFGDMRDAETNDALRTSRTAKGAHRAREWLREKGARLRLSDQDDHSVAIFANGLTVVGVCVSAPTEHLATARLLLVLAATGELEGEG